MTTQSLEMELIELLDMYADLECERDGCTNLAEWKSQFVPCMCNALLCTPHKIQREKRYQKFNNIVCFYCDTRVNNLRFIPI